MAARKKHNTKKLLSGTNRRVTVNRELLLDIIYRSEGHFDADEIYRKAREISSTISLSTVYRNIRVFKRLGLIEERHFSDDHHHYEKKRTLDHQHFECTSCGRIIELPWPQLESAKRKVSERFGFKITEVEIGLKGLCRECMSKWENKR